MGTAITVPMSAISSDAVDEALSQISSLRAISTLYLPRKVVIRQRLRER